MKTLLLVDYENEWMDPNSEYFIGDLTEVINKTNQLIIWARGKGYKIIFTLHEELDSETAFRPNSPNTQLIQEIQKQHDDIVMKKNKISPFYRTDLEKYLEGTDELIVAGILTNLCVRSTVSDAYDRDMLITVVKDCCASLDSETQTFTFKDLKATRPEVNFMNVSEILG